MIVSLLMTIEGSQPKVSRLVNVENSMHLGALSHVIDAAFGFSGGESHMYMSTGPGAREVLTTHPSEGERAENDITVAEMKPMIYVYDPSANWNIHVEVLGTSRLDGPTPLLIDALGPDVVEACNGPTMMSKFHAEARRIAAGLDPDMEVAPLLLSFLPVMTPDRLLQRLTQADPVIVSERISFVAEDLMIDSASSIEQDPLTQQLATEFEDFLETRPDLMEIMSIDPSPEHNPALIAAMAGFFEDRLGEDPPLAPEYPNLFRETVEAILGYFAEPVKLTATGALPSRVVRAVGQVLGYDTRSQRPRETSLPLLATTREILTEAGLLKNTQGRVRLGESGARLLSGGASLDELHLAMCHGFEETFGAREWRAVVKWIANENGIIASGPQGVPADLAGTYDLLRALGVVEESVYPPGHYLTHGGHLLIQRMLELGEH
ncbi:plasmid pRiA4b ORF-3 family protein [Corynebacterium sanguinis]|uniref:plasmid pRiA4b ORF-3 family protein n=1 Tax=Corynebacterium sanguinis TaxID=2594913 RepID=UPI0021A6C4A8|nr:plasmid pRiA4b ORF-3 family protein [Corynebacterium sanguinis]MCT1412962.1 plasmid pRiA4b ORF-3 family protein [Corynebacterium sanguinis]